MRSMPSPKKVFNISAVGFALVFCASMSMAEPVAATLGSDRVQQAGISTESITPPALVSILGLSVAAITLVRRRVRH